MSYLVIGQGSWGGGWINTAMSPFSGYVKVHQDWRTLRLQCCV